MKFLITEWIKSGDISPLYWGASSEQITQLFANSSKEIASLKQKGYPYIILDFVEFYFLDDKDFLGLEEIVIKAVSLYKGIKTNFINPGWLTGNLTFEIVTEKLNEMQVSWQIERGPHFDTPNIRTSTGLLFAFDPDRVSDNEAELQKIYLKK